jgi:DNA end-binding protein Ku
MATRASWKDHLKIDQLSCAVGLYAAVSSSDRISVNIINRKDHHRVERRFVDSETGKPVAREGQLKGYKLERKPRPKPKVAGSQKSTARPRKAG